MSLSRDKIILHVENIFLKTPTLNFGIVTVRFLGS